MATGAGDDYWDRQKLPAVVKHCILRRYLPIFLARTSMHGRRVVVMDGYAGRGNYDDGRPGSAGMMLEWALTAKQGARPVDYVLRFFEKDKANHAALSSLVDDYKARGVDVTAERADVVTRLPSVLDEALGVPLFLFVDPTGVGLPFDDLVAALNRPRNRQGWPPTEALVNFSYEAVRRIGGHVKSPKANEKTLQRLDEALGGDWWREYFTEGVTDEAVDAVVAGFIERLAGATKCFIASIPVRRDLHHKPLYSLAFASRYRRAEWLIGDVTAKCLDEGRREADERAGRLAVLSPTRRELEDSALPEIKANLLDLVGKVGEVTVGDYAELVFGDHWGLVGDTVVRRAIKSLHAEGKTPSNGVGGKVEDLRISPNP